MIQKKGHTAAVKYHLLGWITVVGIVSALWCQSFVSLADSTGKVNVNSAVIRESADTGSAAVASASRGNTVTITDEVQDSSGKLWYKVYVDGNKTGYIRSDLVDKQDGDSGSNAAQSASGASIDPDTFTDPQYAAVSANSIMVRSAPSTNESVVDKLTRDAQVIVSGQSDGSDGKVWFYVTFTGTNGAERTGYIRSDLLSLGDMVPVPEEEAPEPQETAVPEEPTEPVNDDYKLTCEPSADGTDVWYLTDYTSGTGQGDKYLVSQLMEATRVRNANDAEDAKTLVRQRIAIVVLIVLAVALIVAVVIMALKLRDVYYEDYEDEDEEAEEETPAQRRRREREKEETPTQRRRRAQEQETPTQRRRRTEEEETSTQRRRRTEEEPSQRRRRAAESEDSSEKRRRRTEEDDAAARRRRRMEDEESEADSSAGKTASKRKTKNFLLDDDEFEFEFLNMDDKNL